MNRCKPYLAAWLALFLAVSPGSAWALSAYELLDLMVEEKVISPEKAAKIKAKARKIERMEKAREEAQRTRELEQVKQEAGAEAKVEAAEVAQAAATETPPKPDWKAYWDNGLKVESSDGKHQVKIGGRLQVDFAGISSSDRALVNAVEAAEGRDLLGFGSEFRRARLGIEGKVYRYVDFKAEYDFAGGDSEFKDVYVGLSGIPTIGHVRVGHIKEPFSLEELTSSKYITFMERALPNVFSSGRNNGLMAFNTAFNKRLWWGAGVFLDTDDFGDNFNNYQDWNLTARLAATPLYADEGRRLLLLGLAYSHQFRNDSEFQLSYRQRPETHITDARTVNTGSFFTEGVDLFNPQMALVWGPFSLQSEYLLALTDANAASNPGLTEFKGDPTFQGIYVYSSWFLTGESRPFSQSAAAFGRLKPRTDFDPFKGGWGAWELAARYSYLSLNSRGLRGGIENNFTAALNWYLNPNTRWMLNYVYAHIDKREDFESGALHIAQTRFQIDF